MSLDQCDLCEPEKLSYMTALDLGYEQYAPAQPTRATQIGKC